MVFLLRIIWDLKSSILHFEGIEFERFNFADKCLMQFPFTTTMGQIKQFHGISRKFKASHAFTIIPMLHFCSAFWLFHVLANAVMHWWDGSIRTYKLSMSNFVDIIASSKNLYYQLQSFCNNSLGLSPPPHMGAIAVLNLKVAM